MLQNYDLAYNLATYLLITADGRNSSSIVKAKKVLNQAPYLSIEEGLMLEFLEQDQIIGEKNQMEAVFSNLQKRPGNFHDYR